MARKQRRRAARRKSSRKARSRKSSVHAKSRIRAGNPQARIRGFAAIRGVRRKDYKSLTAAARAEGTTVQSIKSLLPGALFPSKPGERLRVRPNDRYSQLVQILTDAGPVDVMAHGSRERELAGQHRAAYLSVLRGNQLESILRKFRGKKVGGRKLLTKPDRLFELAQGGVIDDLDALYVSPEASV